MRHLHHALIALTVFLILATACAPRNGADQPPAAQPATLAATDTPVVGLPTEAAVTQSLAPITLPVPVMQVGSLYRYFDGVLLDAVPNDGPVQMGSNGRDNPLHQVTVSDFWIYSTEVSNQMYAWCVGLGKCLPPDAAANPGYADARFTNYPVVGVDWQQASDYCAFAHGRLPTEAEWEKAASWDASLKQKRLYPWGSHRLTCDLVNYKTCIFKSAPVTNYAQARSFYGALNMAGNVYEWVSDWYSPTYYGSSPVQDPTGPQTGTRRSFRSSAFGSDGYMVDPTWRSSATPTARRADLGFRCVVQAPTYFAPFCTMAVYYGAPAAGSSTVTPQATCPDPSIAQAAYCGNSNTPVISVTVHNSPPTIVTVTGLDACTPTANDANAAHQCPPGVTIHVEATCPVNPAGSPTCPANYAPDPKDPKKCTSPGAPGACPAGFQYDQSLKCCSAAPGNKAAVPLCAVGQRPYNGMCVDDAGGPVEPASPTLVTSSGLTCSSGGKGCALTQASCGKGQIFNPATCSCGG